MEIAAPQPGQKKRPTRCNRGSRELLDLGYFSKKPSSVSKRARTYTQLYGRDNTRKFEMEVPCAGIIRETKKTVKLINLFKRIKETNRCRQLRVDH